MKHPDEELISKMDRDADQDIVDKFLKINRMIKEREGVGLLEKSPEAIALLCIGGRIDFLTGVLFHKNVPELTANTVAQDGESIIAVSVGIATKCACRIDPIGTGLAHDWLQAWLADHPGHIRNEHIFVMDAFKWLEGRVNGGRA